MKQRIKAMSLLLAMLILGCAFAGCGGKAIDANTGAKEYDVEIAGAEATQPVSVPTEVPTPDPNEIRYFEGGELEAIIARNEYSSDERRIFVESALSLVGKVTYFWGGKSYSMGPDPAWGEMRKVTSPGDPTTGQTIPYGLDCSGFILWCGIQLGHGNNWASKNIGEGTWHQWQRSEAVDMSELRPGDIAFKYAYPGADTNHIGIVVGFLENGEPVMAHCSSTAGKVVVSTAADTFSIYRKLNFMD